MIENETDFFHFSLNCSWNPDRLTFDYVVNDATTTTGEHTNKATQ